MSAARGVNFETSDCLQSNGSRARVQRPGLALAKEAGRSLHELARPSRFYSTCTLTPSSLLARYWKVGKSIVSAMNRTEPSPIAKWAPIPA